MRDYGTATWEGGDPECDHVETRGTTRGGPSSTLTGGQDLNPHKTQYRDLCGKCGARRIDNQIGLEDSPEAYVAKLVDVFREVRRLLRADGTLWLNLGDSYASGSKGTGGPSDKQVSNAGSRYEARKFNHGVKDKDLIGIPWMVAFALRADGWYLRSDIIWHKPNPMPESVTDRPTKSHEYIFLLSKSSSYFYDADAIKEPSVTNDMRRPYGSQGAWDMDGRPEHQRHGGELRSKRDSFKRIGSKREAPIVGQAVGTHRPDREESDWDTATRNKRSVWTVTTKPYAEAHFATYPPDLIEPCILAGSRVGDMVLDPFNGSGTTGAVALKHHRRYVGIDLNPAYLELARRRIERTAPLLFPVEA